MNSCWSISGIIVYISKWSFNQSPTTESANKLVKKQSNIELFARKAQYVHGREIEYYIDSKIDDKGQRTTVKKLKAVRGKDWFLMDASCFNNLLECSFIGLEIKFIRVMATVCNQRQTQAFKRDCLTADNRCVCQICTCKKHHCPPKHVPFNADTTNHQFYKPYSIAPERPVKCAYSLNKAHYDPDLLKSTYRANYKGEQSQPNRYQSRYAYQPNTAKFYDETEYKKSYVPNQIAVQKPTHCGSQYRPNSARFDGTTTYNENFTGKKSEKTELRKHYAYQSNNLPFYGHTTYGDSFQRYKIQADKPHGHCQGQYTGSPGRFQGRSSYKDQFQGLQNPKCCRCLVEQLPARPRECSPGKDHLYFSAQEGRWK